MRIHQERNQTFACASEILKVSGFRKGNLKKHRGYVRSLLHRSHHQNEGKYYFR